MQSNRRYLLIFLIVFLVILVLISSLIVLNKNKNNTATPSDTTIQNPTEIIINDKKIENPTFSDLGFSIKLDNKQQQLVKILNVTKSNGKILATVQTDTDPKSTQEILFYDPASIKSILADNVKDGYIYSNDIVDSKILDSSDDIFSLLEKNKNKNVLLVFYTKINSKNLESFTKCNTKLINNLKQETTSKLDCMPGVWELSTYENQ